MYLKRLTLANFKCYRQDGNQSQMKDTSYSNVKYQQFDFSPGLNYLVGNNNSGKTTVLEAIGFLRNGLSARGMADATSMLRSMKPNTQLSKEGNKGDAENDVADDADGLSSSKSLDYGDIALSDKEYFVEGIFANVTDDIDVLDKRNAEKFRKLVLDDKLTVRRYFGPNDKSTELKYKNSDGSFSNVTGIDAPFKSLFDPTFIESTTTPDDVLDFSSTKTLGKLTAAAQDSFKQSEEWTKLSEAYHAAFQDADSGYVSYLDELRDAVNKQVRDQYGAIEVSFNFNMPEPSTLIKSGVITVDDGFLQSDLSSKGNGLQRAVALALLQVYATRAREEALRKKSIKKGMKAASGNNANENMTASAGELRENHATAPLFLCLDEPEIWLHPSAQIKLAKALADIASNEQMWISTHSPYILKAFKGRASTVDSGIEEIQSDNTMEDGHLSKLYVFHDFDSKESKCGRRIVSNETLGMLHPGEPSLGEISFAAFQIPTPEFHSELFGNLQVMMGVNTINRLGEAIKSRPYSNDIEPALRCYSRFDSRSLDKANIIPISDEYLPIYIRNCIDHPEAIGKKLEALQRAENGDQHFAPYLQQLKRIDNQFDDCMLFESILMLQSIYEHEREWRKHN